MNRLEEFLNEQHSISDRRKTAYREALRGFERVTNAEFEVI